MKIPENISHYISELVKEYPEIESIWIIGSRANNTHSEDSDWDFLVFANEHIFSQLKRNILFKRNKIDLLVVLNGNDFEEPWPDLNHELKLPKSGSLDKWEWKEISPNEAEYTGTKDIKGVFSPLKKRQKAWRLWP